jgi:hypothetical protein
LSIETTYRAGQSAPASNLATAMSELPRMCDVDPSGGVYRVV